MISKYNHKELNWVDLESPREEEILHVIEQYSIPLSIKDSILAKNNKDIIEIDHNSAYISIAGKITFVVNDDFFLTIHEEPMTAFDTFSKEMELDTTGKEEIKNHKLLFAYLLKNLYINSENQKILNINQIKNLQKKIENNKKKNKRLLIIIIFLILFLIISIWL